jgi:hypothetical protein
MPFGRNGVAHFAFLMVLASSVGSGTAAAQPAPPTIVGPPVGAILRDAGTRMLVDPNSVRVVRFAAERWSDSTLGCSSVNFAQEPGVTPGFQVVVQVGRFLLDYRTDERRNRILLCSVLTMDAPRRASEFPDAAEPASTTVLDLNTGALVSQPDASDLENDVMPSDGDGTD